MGKMKSGTNIGLDKNLINIKVGDSICDQEGEEYVINAYGMAVAVKGGGTHRLSELKGVYVIKSPSVPSGPVEERQELLKKALENMTDLELAYELRARGYEVKATKTTIIEL